MTGEDGCISLMLIVGLWNLFMEWVLFHARLEESACTKDALVRLTDELEVHLTPLGCPVVFCHNDLVMRNIIWDEDSSSVSFIDFEYSAPNYQPFDIANHFSEYCGELHAFFFYFYPSAVNFQLRLHVTVKRFLCCCPVVWIRLSFKVFWKGYISLHSLYKKGFFCLKALTQNKWSTTLASFPFCRNGWDGLQSVPQRGETEGVAAVLFSCVSRRARGGGRGKGRGAMEGLGHKVHPCLSSVLGSVGLPAGLPLCHSLWLRKVSIMDEACVCEWVWDYAFVCVFVV